MQKSDGGGGGGLKKLKYSRRIMFRALAWGRLNQEILPQKHMIHMVLRQQLYASKIIIFFINLSFYTEWIIWPVLFIGFTIVILYLCQSDD